MDVITTASRFAVFAVVFSMASAQASRAEPKVAAPPPHQSSTSADGNSSEPTAGRRLPLPPRDIQILFVRSALAALDQANKTQNYEVLRALAASNVRRQPATVIATAFRELAASGLDLAPALVIEPEFTRPPIVTQANMLRLTGLFRSQPIGIRFDMVFAAEGGFWRLAAISAGSAGKLPAAMTARGNVPAKGKRDAKAATSSAKPKKARPAYYADGTPVATSAW